MLRVYVDAGILLRTSRTDRIGVGRELPGDATIVHLGA